MAVATELRRVSREVELVVRFGGEEFVLIMPECWGGDATHRAEDIRESLASLHPCGIYLTASLGVTELPLAQPCSFDELFKSADIALYRAKARGRDRVEYREVPPRQPKRAPVPHPAWFPSLRPSPARLAEVRGRKVLFKFLAIILSFLQSNGVLVRLLSQERLSTRAPDIFLIALEMTLINANQLSRS